MDNHETSILPYTRKLKLLATERIIGIVKAGGHNHYSCAVQNHVKIHLFSQNLICRRLTKKGAK